jgi:DNA-binding response OmpR family regulator
MIVVAVWDDQPSIVEVLEMSADRHLSEPHGAVHLPARPLAVLRRGTTDQTPGPVLVTVAELVIDAGSCRMFHHDDPLQVAAREFDLLRNLAQRIVAVATGHGPLADRGHRPCDSCGRAVGVCLSWQRRRGNRRNRDSVGVWATVPAAV